MKKNVTLIIDAKNVMYASFKGSLEDEYLLKYNVNGIYYFLYKLRKILSEFLFHPNYKITKVICFWDGKKSGILRENLYPQYKAQRHTEKTRLQDLEQQVFQYQIEVTKELLKELGILSVSDLETEADDLIAMYVNNNQEEQIFILTTDLDIYQLINKNVKIYNAKKSKSKLATFRLIDNNTFKSVYSYIPENIPVYKALCGDVSDNIEGVRGLKMKTLIKHFPQFSDEVYSLDRIYEEATALLNNNKIKVINTLLESKDKIEINYKIVNLKMPIISEFIEKNFKFILDEKVKYNEALLNSLFVKYNLDKAFKKDHNIVSSKKFLLTFKKTFNYE